MDAARIRRWLARPEPWYALAALILARAALQPGTVLGDRTGDMAEMLLPWRSFAARWIHEGVVPWWNPASFAGTPHHAAMIGGLAYPATWLGWLLPVHVALTLELCLHVVLAAAGARALAAARGCAPLGAAVAGAAYGFGWTTLGHVAAGHVPQVAGLAWLPWVVHFGTPAVDPHTPGPARARAAALAALALGAGVCAGHPHYPWLAGFALAVLAVRAAAAPGLPGAVRVRPLYGLAFVSALAAGVAAVQLLPTLAFLPESARGGGLPDALAGSYHLPALHLPLALAPGLCGPRGMVTYWAAWNPWEGVAAIGIVPLLLLAAAGLGTADRRGLGWLAGIGLLLALGPDTPVHGLARDVLPGFGVFRSPSRAIALAALAAAVCAGSAADALLAEGDVGRRAGRRVAIAAGVVGGGLVAWLVVLLASGPEGAPWRWCVDLWHVPNDFGRVDLRAGRDAGGFLAESHREAVRAVLGAAGVALALAGVAAYRAFGAARRTAAVALLAILAGDLAWACDFGLPATTVGEALLSPASRRALPEPRELWRVVHIGGRADQGMAEGVLALDGYDANLPARTARLLARGEGWPDDAPVFVSGLSRPGAVWRAGGVRTVLVRGGIFGDERTAAALAGLRAAPGWVEQDPVSAVWRFETTAAAPRVRWVGRAHVAGSAEEALAAVAEGRVDPGTEVVLEGDAGSAATRPSPAPPAGEPRGRAEASAGFAARITAEGPNRVAIDVDGGVEPGWCVLADAFASGWRATVDGAPAEILRADYAFRAVAVPPGRHAVVFTYRPPGLWPGILATLSALVLIGGILRRTQRLPGVERSALSAVGHARPEPFDSLPLAQGEPSPAPRPDPGPRPDPLP